MDSVEDGIDDINDISPRTLSKIKKALGFRNLKPGEKTMLKEELDKLKRYAYSSVVVITQDDAILSVGLLEDVIEETKELWNNDVLDSTESVVLDQKIAILTVIF